MECLFYFREMHNTQNKMCSFATVWLPKVMPMNAGAKDAILYNCFVAQSIEARKVRRNGVQLKIQSWYPYLLFCFLSFSFSAMAQTTRFEKSNGKETATYVECIDHYRALAKQSKNILIKTMDTTDAGYPLHLVLYSTDKSFDPTKWVAQKKVVVLINNGIHPGEPDGIDASMLLLRQLLLAEKNNTDQKYWLRLNKLPSNVVLAIIPVYNIGGCLNRNSFSRVNQEGPIEHGFRGNAQNLDLNRDFTKCDSKDALAFTKIFHWLNPHILVDTHVSDGADYQHVMTLLSTNYGKSGMGELMHKTLDPALFAAMAKDGFPMTPYVNFESEKPEEGMTAFYDEPRYSSGYATLFNCIAYMTETHMLKPYAQRVQSTFLFAKNLLQMAADNADVIFQQQAIAQSATPKMPLSWKVDTTKFDWITFLGYASKSKKSEVTGFDRMYYDRSAPYSMQVKYYCYFLPTKEVEAPKAYIVPQGWHAVTERMKANAVQMKRLLRDTVMEVEMYHIDDYKSYSRPYEKHHVNYAVQTSVAKKQQKFLKGDYVIETNQLAKRYIVEMLEPTGDDSFFAWNFFDAILQQKEGYSDYRWEDVAADFLQKNPLVKEKLEAKKKADAQFANNASAQLEFVYKLSPWYEPAHLMYPVCRLMN